LLRRIAPMNPNMRNEKLRGVFEELGLESNGMLRAAASVFAATTKFALRGDT
jgi:hypothetical protein